ncbi:MAG: short-chain fatty acid transporter [Myxococcales bacterium]|nr:short-chain fatty acid transporter [Myxococcales bacterium]
MDLGSPIRKLGGGLSRWSEKWVPDPFVLAILLTLVSLLIGRLFFSGAADPGTPVLEVLLEGWRDSFFSPGLLRFAFQMCLVLVTGHALATAPSVQRLTTKLAALPKTTAQAAVLVSLVSMLAGILHWGLAAVVGAFLAREIGRGSTQLGKRLHYPVLGAAAYMGLLVWHGGLSGSAPLAVASEGHFLASTIGVIPTSETLFSAFNLTITGTVLVVVPLLLAAMAPKGDAQIISFSEVVKRGISDTESPARDPHSESNSGFSAWLENSRFLSSAIGSLGLVWIGTRLALGKVGFDLDSVNFLFLFIGLLAQGSPRQYAEAVVEGAKGSAGIILQFPFYFGILGLLKASGLIGSLAAAMAGITSDGLLGVATFWMAGLVNLFVPSGGGQWAIQGELVCSAATASGASVPHTIMAFAYGDALTNMLQPFWALPLLGITGLKAREIVGYTAAIMIIIAPLISVLVYLMM